MGFDKAGFMNEACSESRNNSAGIAGNILGRKSEEQNVQEYVTRLDAGALDNMTRIELVGVGTQQHFQKLTTGV